MSSKLRVHDYMQRAVITVERDMEIMAAVHRLLSRDISGAPVVDEAGRLCGMLTERDCLAVALQAGYFDEPGGRVADYMSTEVVTVAPDTTLMDIAEQFRDTRFRRFPVVEAGLMVGIISRRDVLVAMQSGAWFSRTDN
ncbi:MAG: CBS domain-containing protein [Pseudomonadota bacterium]